MMRRRFDWWYWLGTAVLLSAALSASQAFILGAIAITAAHLVHFAYRTGSAVSFPVQVRAAYLALLLAGMWPPLFFLHWIQFVGTWALVFFDYCFLARCVSLLPWNRGAPLSWRHVLNVFVSPPVKGNVLQGVPAAITPVGEKQWRGVPSSAVRAPEPGSERAHKVGAAQHGDADKD